jgi:hypothetical protein
VRKAWWVGAVIASAALVLPALAQQPDPEKAKSFFTGVNPRNITQPKIDPVKAMRGSSVSQALKPPTSARSGGVFSLGSYFPRVTVASWPPQLPSFSKTKTSTMPQPTTVPRSSVSLFNKPPQ